MGPVQFLGDLEQFPSAFARPPPLADLADASIELIAGPVAGSEVGLVRSRLVSILARLDHPGITVRRAAEDTLNPAAARQVEGAPPGLIQDLVVPADRAVIEGEDQVTPVVDLAARQDPFEGQAGVELQTPAKIRRGNRELADRQR